MKNYLLSLATEKPWIIPKEKNVVTDLSNEERVQQIVLEKMLENTHEEIPYIADIQCTSIENMNDKRMKINVDIFVDTSPQVRIVVGQQGRTLVKIRQAASEVLEEIFDKQVLLFLWIKKRGKLEVETRPEDGKSAHSYS